MLETHLFVEYLVFELSLDLELQFGGLIDTLDLGGAVGVGGVMGDVQGGTALLPAELYFLVGTVPSAGRVDDDRHLWFEYAPETGHVASASTETIVSQEDSLEGGQ